MAEKMNVIVLNEDNIEKILGTGTDATEADLRNLIAASETVGLTYYFADRFVSPEGVADQGWASFSEDYVAENYAFDHELVKTDFVEFNYKGPVNVAWTDEDQAVIDATDASFEEEPPTAEVTNPAK